LSKVQIASTHVGEQECQENAETVEKRTFQVKDEISHGLDASYLFLYYFGHYCPY
jgi:hypothetical protein